jgi:A/G-specific adenine glycosylase
MGSSQSARGGNGANGGARNRARTLRRALLRWGELQGRHFFWREFGLSPFSILIVEILLTKTRAEVVEPVALRLLERFPDPVSLAGANRRSLEKLLYPLGLHRKRARQLIACAKTLGETYGNQVPRDVATLLELPSVGRYAANAVAVVAFGQRRPVIDANLARIYGRVFSLPPPPPRLSSAHDLWELARQLLPKRHVKEFTWAALDLGGTVCSARQPACTRCPLRRVCSYAIAQGAPRRETVQ